MSRFTLLLIGGCALFERSAPLDVRYFEPAIGAVARDGARTPLRAWERGLTLGRVTSSAALRTRIVHRDAPNELGEYESLRWTDNPEVYVRRALQTALYGGGVFEEREGSATLDVEVVRFEEVRRGAEREGAVSLRYVVRDGDDVVARGEVSAVRPAARADMNAIVDAISRALSAAALEIERRVLAIKR